MPCPILLLVASLASTRPACDAFSIAEPPPAAQACDNAPTHTRLDIYTDLATFDLAAGRPAIVLDFEAFEDGTDLSDVQMDGLTLVRTASPLIVVEAAETWTTADYANVRDPEHYALRATSGRMILSPGGPRLAPGPDPDVESDGLTFRFDPPIAVFALDHLSQSADGMSFTHVMVISTDGQTLYSGDLPVGELFDQRFRWDENASAYPAPGASFWGIISDTTSIAEIRVTEADADNACPDCNVGYDSIRYAPAPAGVIGDVNGDGLRTEADVRAVLAALAHPGGPSSGESGRRTDGSDRTQPGWLPADLNRDGRVDGADLLLLRAD